MEYFVVHFVYKKNYFISIVVSERSYDNNLIIKLTYIKILQSSLDKIFLGPGPSCRAGREESLSR